MIPDCTLLTTRQCRGGCVLSVEGQVGSIFSFAARTDPVTTTQLYCDGTKASMFACRFSLKKKSTYVRIVHFQMQKMVWKYENQATISHLRRGVCVSLYVICIHTSLFFNQRTVKELQGILSLLLSPIGNSFLLQVLEYLWPWETRQIYG